jgi:8-oxo-dGTP diphosphatase
LIVRNRRGDSYYWSLPGGAVEAGETLEQAAIREVEEETGYKIAISGLHSVREAFYSENGHHTIIVTFLAAIIGGELRIDDPDHDIVEGQWATVETVKERMPSLFDALKLSADRRKTPAFYAFEGIK